MLDPHTGLGASHRELSAVLETAPDLREGPQLDTILELLAQRRTMDLSDLPPADQAQLVSARTQALLPSVGHLDELLTSAKDRQLIVKFGIDPTAADVHVGHAVPMILASRFQRMGHRVVFIVGDITAKIGDPTGRVADRPPLTDDDIRANMQSYRDQVTPFFDFEHADFRFNSEWLAPFTLPQFIGVLEGLPSRYRCSGRTSATASKPAADYPWPSWCTQSSWRWTRSRSTPTSNSVASTSC